MGPLQDPRDSPIRLLVYTYRERERSPHYGLALFFGCASSFPVDNSLCSPVRLLPKGVYTSACAYNTSGQVFTGTHGCGCSKATGNFLGCWDGSDASAAPPVCQTVFSPNVVGCSDCKTVCPQP